MRARLWLVFGLALLPAGVAGAIAAEQAGALQSPHPPLVIRSLAGRDLFEFYCASCHGRDGRGGGPVAPAMRTPPPDLTTIARRVGGSFPRARVEGYVRSDEDASRAHGSREMPVWGPIFLALDPSDTLTKIRIDNVVAYLESLQVR